MGVEETDPQIDFSGGQINRAARRRADLPAVRNGGSVVRNWRCNNTGQLEPRPGRRGLFQSAGRRSDQIRVSTGEEFILTFGAGSISLVTSAGLVAAFQASPTYLWSATNTNLISWAQAQDDVYICFSGMRPQQIHWDRNARSWSFLQFAFDAQQSVIKQPYYRLSALGATMSYSAATGTPTLTCSVPYFTNSMVGTTLSVMGQQVTINSVTDSQHAVVTPAYRLPDTIAVQVVDVTPFVVGQIVSAVSQNIKFEVGFIDTTNKWVHGVLMSNMTFQTGQFTNSDTLASPLGSSKFGASAPTAGNTNLPTVQWAEEFMSALRGWPSFVGYDRKRLMFTGFPQAQNAILWGAIAAPNSHWVDSVAATNQPSAGADASSAILELITNNPTVKYVVGWQQGQFSFTDRGVFFIPISNASPLKAGNVEFDKISDDGVGLIRPVTIQDAIMFINAGLNRVSAVRATGSYTRPMIVEDVSDLHTDLFISPICLAVATGDGKHPERYVYVVNSDGSVVVGKVLLDRSTIGWSPWVSAGKVSWVTTAGANVYYTSYYVNGSGVEIDTVEIEDDSMFLDFAIPINSPPTGLTPPGGRGPFWLFPGATVTLMDGNKDMGDRSVSVTGAIVPLQGEDLSSPTIYAGFFTPCVFNPIVEFKQAKRTRKANISRATVNVEKASQFTLGTRTIPVQHFGDDATAQPILNDGIYWVRSLGRSADPTIDFIKDRPGPLRLCELDLEVSH
jgi:hypothetical protein